MGTSACTPEAGRIGDERFSLEVSRIAEGAVRTKTGVRSRVGENWRTIQNKTTNSYVIEISFYFYPRASDFQSLDCLPGSRKHKSGSNPSQASTAEQHHRRQKSGWGKTSADQVLKDIRRQYSADERAINRSARCRPPMFGSVPWHLGIRPVSQANFARLISMTGAKESASVIDNDRYWCGE